MGFLLAIFVLAVLVGAGFAALEIRRLKNMRCFLQENLIVYKKLLDNTRINLEAAERVRGEWFEEANRNKQLLDLAIADNAKHLGEVVRLEKKLADYGRLATVSASTETLNQ